MFPGTTNVGNVTLDNVNVTTTFYFRISAVVFVEEGITDEGYLSNVIHPVIIERLEGSYCMVCFAWQLSRAKARSSHSDIY